MNIDTTDTNDMPALLMNPYYVITIADYFFEIRDYQVAEEYWVTVNDIFIHNRGAETWLEELLLALSIDLNAHSDDLAVVAINPAHTLTISDKLRGVHEPIIDRPTWIAANVKLMSEIGTVNWLWKLLQLLETGTE